MVESGINDEMTVAGRSPAARSGLPSVPVAPEIVAPPGSLFREANLTEILKCLVVAPGKLELTVVPAVIVIPWSRSCP